MNVYICSPYAGRTGKEPEITDNVIKARRYCREAMLKQNVFPICPQIYFTQFLDDSNPDERERGLTCGLDLLDCCEEIWVYGSYISEGMKAEIEHAQKHEISIKYVEVQ
ncbi:hypothetical protein FACS1894132_09840 [Clostridia bacterium]|nr:hypothetical protein FACS1894132_09840 [Clostridia bacterium]